MACPHCGSASAPASGRCVACGRAVPVGGPALAVLTPPGVRPQIPNPRDPASDSAENIATMLPPRVMAEGPLAVGESFGPRYHILALLGSGGMGAVYHAWDNDLGVAVALKVIRPEILRDRDASDDLERRFKRELVLARQVTHKSVVRIHDLGELNGIKYLTMPYIEGSDLETIVRREKKLQLDRTVRI